MATSVRLTVAVALLSVSPLVSQARQQPSPAGSAGVVFFENSGATTAQAPFARGLALLHDFEYERAAAEFQEAQAADPDFAMAYWGEAMTYNHPVWMEQDRDAARRVLAKLGRTPEARARKAGTERERDYLAAVETLYGDGPKAERDARYEAAMAALQAKYPADVDAAAFHALSILGTSHAGRDFATYMRAAAILEEVFPEHRNHPGVLHYLIHSYDDPIHAPLGLRAARLYGAVAPDAGHALHMTSHIFVALGMWDDVIAANERAIAVVNGQRAADGRGEVLCGHYPSWLVYAYLQERKIDRARAYIDGCRGQALKELQARAPESADPDNSLAGSYLWVRTMLAADTGEWKREDDVPLDHASDRERFADAYGSLLGANAAGDRAALVAASTELDRLAPVLVARLDSEGDPSISRRAAINAARLQGEGLVQLRSGDSDGIASLQQAAALEASAPLEFGPPVVEKPSYELLGDELMRLKRHAEAESAYAIALARTPGRTLTIEGLRKAQQAMK
jgi:tetratricopeptide (TPR) repeat protein